MTKQNNKKSMIKSADKIRQELRDKQHRIWIKFSWKLLAENFKDRKEFNEFVASLNPDNKNKFIWLSAFWYIMGNKPKMAYKQTQKIIVSFSVIESLYEEDEYQDFFTWLNTKRLKEKTKEFNGDSEKILKELQTEWKNKYGSSEKMRIFLRENLSERQRQTLFNHFKIKKSGDEKFREIKNVDEFSECLIIIRNSFIHKAKVIDVFLDSKSIASSMLSRISKNYIFNSPINFEFIESIFKSGFVNYFKTHK